MELTYTFLQHYWWLIVSILAATLVFLMFVQGGQSLLFCVAKTHEHKNLIINVLGHKWELTFTTLVTFGGAFFASFPLFYSTSFGGAIYVWMLILFLFVIQAVGYEYRSKPNNLLGIKTYEYFLFFNGLLGTILIGTAVGTFFTGSEFIVNTSNISNLTSSNVISQWQNPWHGIEAVLDYRNVALGLAVFFLSRILAIQYFYNQINDKELLGNLKKTLIFSAVAFLITFLTFLISILLSKGWSVEPITGIISIVEFKYFTNLIQMPIVLIMLLVGIVMVLWSLFISITKQSRKAIWFGGLGTIITVVMLMLMAGWNNTSYYPSVSDIQSSLTIFNSSSSEFTLRVMFYVSFFIPVVIGYIWYAWYQMSKKPETTKTDTY